MDPSTWDWEALLSVPTVLLVLDWAIRIFAVIYIPRNRRPQTAAAWLLAIFFLPAIVGLALFLLFGSRRIPRRRRERQAAISEYIQDTTGGEDRLTAAADWPDWLPPIVELNQRLGSMPLVGGNDAELLPDYEESIARMSEAVRDAQRRVHVEFYILILDDTTRIFFDALADAVRRGLAVRVLYDHVACVRSPGYLRTMRELKRIGVQWHPMLPIQPWRGRWQRPDLRNHRKILVCDGDVAFVGSQNMVDSTYNRASSRRRGLHWKDLMVRFEGPVVTQLDALVVTDWYSETGELLPRETPSPAAAGDRAAIDAQVVPSGPGFDDESNLRLFNSLLYAATRRVIITSPYFVPDDSMLYAITTAAQRGLDVQLFVSEVGDQVVTHHAQRSYYETLLRSGVRIFCYRAPTILHAKHFTIDDEIAVVGSSNMDMRSFSLNYEVSVMIRSADAVARLRRLEEHYRQLSTELILEEWLRRPRIVQTIDNVARLTAAVQ